MEMQETLADMKFDNIKEKAILEKFSFWYEEDKEIVINIQFPFQNTGSGCGGCGGCGDNT